MASRTPVELVTPPGSRLVRGSVHKPRQRTDENDKPLFNEDGSPVLYYEFGIAIKKTPGVTHWSQETFTDPVSKQVNDWGARIWNEGHAGYPGTAERGDFSWKITDGDSAIPNRKGNKPCDQEGHPGHWVLSFSSMSAPQKYSSVSGNPVLDASEEISQLGDFVQVIGAVVCNHLKNGQSAKTPGVYLNHRAVCYGGRHPEGRISTQAPVNTGLFSAGAAPGASLAPSSGFAASAPPAPAATPAAPVAPPAPTAVVPNPAVMPVPTPSAPPAAPVAAPVRVARNAQGEWPVADLIAGGWTEQTLLANGYTIAN